ncbi:MAG TPA: hypothetical protein VGM05_13955, partial [Planctomycetaceae bacterium]
ATAAIEVVPRSKAKASDIQNPPKPVVCAQNCDNALVPVLTALHRCHNLTQKSYSPASFFLKMGQITNQLNGPNEENSLFASFDPFVVQPFRLLVQAMCGGYSEVAL